MSDVDRLIQLLRLVRVSLLREPPASRLPTVLSAKRGLACLIISSASALEKKFLIKKTRGLSDTTSSVSSMPPGACSHLAALSSVLVLGSQVQKPSVELTLCV